MSNYDSLEDFIDYTSEENWRNYIENDILPLWKNTFILKEFYKYLEINFNNLSLSRINEKDLPLILGGVVKEKEEIYKPNSLAKFYDKVFGLKANLVSWIFSGGKFSPKIKVEKTVFIKFIDEIFNWVDRAITTQGLVKFSKPEIDYEKIKDDPSELTKLIEDFFSLVLKVSVNYNYHTFFLWSLKQIPYRYVKAAYPRIDKIMNFLKVNFGLTIFKWANPFDKNSNLYEEYTILCWPEYNIQDTYFIEPKNSKARSFGGSICVLNEVIWEYMDSYLSYLKEIFNDYITTLPNLKKDYFEKNKYRAEEKGKFYERIYYKEIAASEDGFNFNKIIMEMLNEISPYLFIGLARISTVDRHWGSDRFIIRWI